MISNADVWRFDVDSYESASVLFGAAFVHYLVARALGWELYDDEDYY